MAHAGNRSLEKKKKRKRRKGGGEIYSGEKEEREQKWRNSRVCDRFHYAMVERGVNYFKSAMVGFPLRKLWKRFRFETLTFQVWE